MRRTLATIPILVFAAGAARAQVSGSDIATIALANVGEGACSTNSAGGTTFETSCTGNGGEPEYWCADFAMWVWSQAGVDVSQLDAAAGSFYVYGQNNGTLHDAPALGDAVVFDYQGGGVADHVALVTQVNADGTIESVSGDWNGTGSTEAAFSSTSSVVLNAPAYSSAVGSVPPIMGMTISGFVSPVGLVDADGGTVLPPTVLDQESGNDAVTLVNWTDGHVELFAKTTGGAMQHSATTGSGDSWSALATLDSGADCGSAAAFWGAAWAYPELYSPLAAGGVGHLWDTSGTWNGFQSLGGSGLSHLATLVWPSGLVELFGLGADGAAWHDSFDVSTGSWTGWASLGGSAFSEGPRPLVWADGHGELYEVDSSGNVWAASSASGDGTDWTAFAQIGSGIASRLSPVRWPDGTVELFGRGQDGNVWRAATGPAGAGGLDAFSMLATQAISGEPSAFVNPGGGAELVVRDPAGDVLDLAYSVASGSWPASFTPLGQVTASDPFGWIRGDGNAELFAVDGAGNLIHSLRSAGTWSSWSPIGAGLDACAPAVPVADAGVSTSSGCRGPTSTSSSGGSSSGGTASGRGSSAASGTSSGGAAASSMVATPDGGTRSEEGAGCGCASSGAEGPALWLLGAAALLASRKRSRA